MTHTQPRGGRSRVRDQFYLSYIMERFGLYSVSGGGSGAGPSHASGHGSVSGSVGVHDGGSSVGAAGEGMSRAGAAEWGFRCSYTEE